MLRMVIRIQTHRLSAEFECRDFMIMDKTVKIAKENGVHVGAHPSLPDRQGFGRREMAMDPVLPSFTCNTPQHMLNVVPFVQEELASCFVYQVGALSGFLRLHGMEMNHVGD